jgi:hypothetical protein
MHQYLQQVACLDCCRTDLPVNSLSLAQFDSSASSGRTFAACERKIKSITVKLFLLWRCR